MRQRAAIRAVVLCLLALVCVPAWAQRGMQIGSAGGSGAGFGSSFSAYSSPAYAAPAYGGFGYVPYTFGGIGGLAAAPEPYAAPVIPSYPVAIAEATYDWSTWDPPVAVLLLKDGEITVLGVRRELPLPPGLVAEAREPEPLGDIARRYRAARAHGAPSTVNIHIEHVEH